MDGWVQKSYPTIESCFQGIFGRVIGFGFGLGRSSSIPEGIESRSREQQVSPASMHQRPNSTLRAPAMSHFYSAEAHFYSARLLWQVSILLWHNSFLDSCSGKSLLCCGTFSNLLWHIFNFALAYFLFYYCTFLSYHATYSTLHS